MGPPPSGGVGCRWTGREGVPSESTAQGEAWLTLARHSPTLPHRHHDPAKTTRSHRIPLWKWLQSSVPLFSRNAHSRVSAVCSAVCLALRCATGWRIREQGSDVFESPRDHISTSALSPFSSNTRYMVHKVHPTFMPKTTADWEQRILGHS